MPKEEEMVLRRRMREEEEMALQRMPVAYLELLKVRAMLVHGRSGSIYVGSTLRKIG